MNAKLNSLSDFLCPTLKTTIFISFFFCAGSAKKKNSKQENGEVEGGRKSSTASRNNSDGSDTNKRKKDEPSADDSGVQSDDKRVASNRGAGEYEDVDGRCLDDPSIDDVVDATVLKTRKIARSASVNTRDASVDEDHWESGLEDSLNACGDSASSCSSDGENDSATLSFGLVILFFFDTSFSFYLSFFLVYIFATSGNLFFRDGIVFMDASSFHERFESGETVQEEEIYLKYHLYSFLNTFCFVQR